MHTPGRQQAGLTLTETVIATFILLAGFLVIGALYFSSLRQQSQVDAAILSTMVAEKALEDLRAWAQTPANFDALEATYNPYNAQDQGFQIAIEARPPVPIASPCSQLESAFVATERRLLTSSFKPVQVRVTHGTNTLVLDTLIGDPPRQPRDPVPVVVSPGTPIPVPPASLAKDASIFFTANLVDAAGQPITDIFFTWSQAPVSGTGAFVTPPRDGRGQTFVHKMMMPDGTWSYSPGVDDTPNPDLPSTCRVTANCLYRGKEYTGDSAEVPLHP